MPFSEVVLLAVPRERAGSWSSASFSFQKNWAICELLDRHESNQGYLLACEFHDDVLVVEDPDGEARMHFFQVKVKRTGRWSIGNLVKREKKVGGDEAFSILGKLYDNKLKFPDNTASLNFVSNAPFNITLADSEKDPSISRERIILSEAVDDVRDKARGAVQKEHQLAEPPDFDNYTHLRVTNLSVGDSSGHALGKVEEFLARRAPMRKRHSEPFYKALLTEVSRMSDHLAPVTTYAEFLQHKALSRDHVERFVELAGAELDLDQAWSLIEARMNTEGVAFTRIRSIHGAWRRYEVERMDSRARSLSELRDAVVACIGTALQFDKLTYLLDAVQADERVRFARSNLFSAEYTAAVALMEAYERHEDPKLPPSDPQLEETGQ